MNTEDNKPPKVKPHLKSAPKIGQVSIGMTFLKDTQSPERTGINKLPDDAFNGLLKLTLKWIPKPR
tara:strand:- start:7016 stop:7213 length:198 start_codon:yes stop_codon:yes gene_type:complete